MIQIKEDAKLKEHTIPVKFIDSYDDASILDLFHSVYNITEQLDISAIQAMNYRYAMKWVDNSIIIHVEQKRDFKGIMSEYMQVKPSNGTRRYEATAKKQEFMDTPIGISIPRTVDTAAIDLRKNRFIRNVTIGNNCDIDISILRYLGINLPNNYSGHIKIDAKTQGKYAEVIINRQDTSHWGFIDIDNMNIDGKCIKFKTDDKAIIKNVKYLVEGSWLAVRELNLIVQAGQYVSFGGDCVRVYDSEDKLINKVYADCKQLFKDRNFIKSLYDLLANDGSISSTVNQLESDTNDTEVEVGTSGEISAAGSVGEINDNVNYRSIKYMSDLDIWALIRNKASKDDISEIKKGDTFEFDVASHGYTGVSIKLQITVANRKNLRRVIRYDITDKGIKDISLSIPSGIHLAEVVSSATGRLKRIGLSNGTDLNLTCSSDYVKIKVPSKYENEISISEPNDGITRVIIVGPKISPSKKVVVKAVRSKESAGEVWIRSTYGIIVLRQLYRLNQGNYKLSYEGNNLGLKTGYYWRIFPYKIVACNELGVRIGGIEIYKEQAMKKLLGSQILSEIYNNSVQTVLDKNGRPKTIEEKDWQVQ